MLKINIKIKSKRLKTILIVSAGFLLLGFGVFTALWQDAQAITFNSGLQAYIYAQTAGKDNPKNPVKTAEDRQKALKHAAEMFDLSTQVYGLESNNSWLQRFLFPHPDSLLAARASFREGNCLLWLGDEKAAVAAYKQYLQLNPGGINDTASGDTYTDQHNLEIVYNHNPALQQAEGKGQGKGNQDGGQKGKQQAPGDPSNQAGHSNHTKM
jgi:hypothetical protein